MKMIYKLVLAVTLSAVCLAGFQGCGKGDAEKQKAAAAAKAARCTLDPIVVNLADEDERYLRVTIGLEMKDANGPQLLKDNDGVVKDALLMLLSGKFYQDIRDRQGKEKLKVEIMNTLNGVLKKNCVAKVYFTDFIAQ